MKHCIHRCKGFGPIFFMLLGPLLPSLAYAHLGVGELAGFGSGFSHPWGGIDHLLAMVAVGFWAVQHGERALWLYPGTFVLVMACGGVAGTMGVLLPFAEPGIVLSVMLLGVLVAAAVRLPLIVGALVVGLFAVFHGHAHGAEMPANASGLAYGGGFVLATAFLHSFGIGAALLSQRLGLPNLVRVSGGAISMTGAYLWLAV